MSVKSATTQAMTAIFAAEQQSSKEGNPIAFQQAVMAGIKAGLDFQTIEKALRVAGSQTFIIARNPDPDFDKKHIQPRLPGSTENKKYWFYVANGSHAAMHLLRESQGYDENFAKLKETGFATHISDALPQAGYKKPQEWKPIKDPKQN